ncbi:hypothetical protein T484DRAFT_3155462 [Baffinella frigidus]|nr:hypothetical protein T484DRAFT_3155462 [Cryptophyta sp. CCMP2293]
MSCLLLPLPSPVACEHPPPFSATCCHVRVLCHVSHATPLAVTCVSSATSPRHATCCHVRVLCHVSHATPLAVACRAPLPGGAPCSYGGTPPRTLQ